MAARKVPLEFSEWRPDVATLDTKFASEVENVFAGVNSYLPFPSLQAFTEASLSDAGNDSYTKVLLNFSTDFTDTNVGGSPHTWTGSGGIAITTGDYQFGPGSLLCDGVDDKISTPAHADFNVGAQDFTIDGFFKCTAVAGVTRTIIAQCNSTGTAASSSFFLTRSGGVGNLTATVFVGSTGYSIATPSPLIFTDVLNTGWHHFEFSRFGFKLLLFVDGVLAIEGPFSGTINSSVNALSVGGAGEITSGFYWKGGIDAVRLTVGKARHTDNFIPPKVAYLNAGGRVCGLYSARTEDGGWKIYAGTTTKLLSWSLAGWTDVSRTSGGDYDVPPTELWVFEQTGSHVVAVSINDDPQWADVDAGTPFEALPGSPPRAGHVKQMGDFLFLSRLDDGSTTGAAPPVPVNNRCVVWSGINDPTIWQPGTSLCDMQEFPDGGPVQGVAGAEIGYVVQDRAIRTIQFLPGDTVFIFNFSRVLHDRGCVSKFGFSSIGNVLYFVSEDGFYTCTGQQVQPIGADKVNEWFLANSDADRRDVIHCLAGVNKPRIVWVYHASTASPIYDRQIIFDWSNGRWTKSGIPAQVWGLLSSTGLDLDTTGGEYQDALLDSTASSLDSFGYIGGRPSIGAIDPDGYLATLAGPNLPATMETAEMHLAPGQRAFVNQVYPLDDAASDAPGEIASGTRETLQRGAPFWSPPVPIEFAVGSAFVMTSARLHRFRRFIPYASTWTHAQGVIVDVQPDGEGVNL